MPPPHLSTRALVIQRTVNDWLGLYRADMLIFQARKETLRHLGVLILAALFHRHRSETRLDLLHPASDIKHLVLRTPSGSTIPNYQSQPEPYTYRATRLRSSPWLYQRFPSSVLPCCYLTVQEDDSIPTPEAWSKRDTVIGFGPQTGHVLFAELLLNASQTWSEETEFELESDGRLGGVGPMSTDVRLWLPGHTYFDDTFFASQ